MEIKKNTQEVQKRNLENDMSGKEILSDILAYMKEDYIACFQMEEDSFRVKFSNGKIFLISIKEIN